MKITTSLAAALIATGVAITSTPSPAAAAAPCDAVTVSSTSNAKMQGVTSGRQRLRFLGVECHPRDTMQRARWSYGEVDTGLYYCDRVESIVVNMGQVGSYNPPPVEAPCSKNGASVEIPFPDQTFGPGKTDRCAGAKVKFTVGGGQKDEEWNMPKVCFPS